MFRCSSDSWCDDTGGGEEEKNAEGAEGRGRRGRGGEESFFWDKENADPAAQLHKKFSFLLCVLSARWTRVSAASGRQDGGPFLIHLKNRASVPDQHLDCPAGHDLEAGPTQGAAGEGSLEAW